jgi:hypothetical protein
MAEHTRGDTVGAGCEQDHGAPAREAGTSGTQGGRARM